MKNQLMHLSDKLLLRKRASSESSIDQLKNISQIEHSRQFCGSPGRWTPCLQPSGQKAGAASR
jgi:Transposase DDE domain